MDQAVIDAFHAELDLIEKVAVSRMAAGALTAAGASVAGGGGAFVGHKKGRKKGRGEGLRVGAQYGYRQGASRGYTAGQRAMLARLQQMQKSRGKTKKASSLLGGVGGKAGKLIGSKTGRAGFGGAAQGGYATSMGMKAPIAASKIKKPSAFDRIKKLFGK
jgi:hypothetical protein